MQYRQAEVWRIFVAYVPMNRARALIIVTRPQDYLPGRLREAARYLLDRKDATQEERRLATEAIELLRSKRDDVRSHDATTQAKPDKPKPAPVRQKRKGRA